MSLKNSSDKTCLYFLRISFVYVFDKGASCFSYVSQNWYNNKRLRGMIRCKAIGIRSSRPKLNVQHHELLAYDDEKSLCASDWSSDPYEPSYGSIVLQIKEANSEAESTCDFLKKATEIVNSTVLASVCVGAFMILPVTMISMGVKYLKECPVEPKIPIYLLVGGCFGLLKMIVILWRQVRSRRSDKIDDFDSGEDGNGDVIMSRSSKFTDFVLSLFLFIWFVCGNIWVLGIYKPYFHQLLHDPSNWCEYTAYMFAFFQIMICYGVMGLIFILMFILVVCHKCTTSSDGD